MNAVYDLPGPHAEALSLLLGRIPPVDYAWALTGSAGLRLQGVDLEVHDLDLQTDAVIIYLLEKELAGFMKVAAHIRESEHSLSHHALAEVRGVQVELLGDMRHRGAAGWLPAPDVRSVRIWVEWRGLQVPVLPLEREAVAYETMGRVEKAALIRAALQRRTK